MEKSTRICGDEALLLWHAAGALKSEESAAVERHIEGCPRCRRLMEENRQLARTYVAVAGESGDHLTPEHLSRLAEGDAESDRGAVGEHLAACAECREIASTVERVHRELESAPLWDRLAGTARSVWSRGAMARAEGWKSISLLLKGPVPAYLMVLLLLYPAYRGLRGMNGEGGLEGPSLLAPPVPISSEVERGPGDNRVRLETGNEHTVLTFFAPIDPDRYRYRVELIGQGGSLLFSEADAGSFDGLGTFALTLPEGFLEPGDYEVRLLERQRENGRTANVFVFPFTVKAP